jgi:flagellar FliL protein
MSAAATADAATPAKPKSKKLLFILIGVVVLALAGAGGALFILKKNTAIDEGGEESSQNEKEDRASRAPPTFLPLEEMVVNLADPGGNRFAQLGITLQVEDGKTAEAIKGYMPNIRNAILILVSQRTSENMLQLEGKEKLATDIAREVSRFMDYPLPERNAAASEAGEASDKAAKKKRAAATSPLQAVLFSSFIVQ